ncbi:hypothetical protein [Methanobrevibacter sp.]|uniref:hypothetical protein n=1 Tax=Methanobrevibacter sp. TaxID=66852 RepID=UPI0025DF632F|nr:hypothetical protein [Methanobrevibacter sp.]MBR4447437.1 hypothetical protein [Methanobrevibacter sp.]
MSTISFLQLLIEIALFLILTGLGILIIKKIPKSTHRVFNPKEYLPEDEIHSLMQVAYLSLMAACFICVLYIFTFQSMDFLYFAVLDIFVSLFIAITADKSSWYHKLFILLLVPYGSLTFILFGDSLIGLLDLIHIPIMVYYIKYYYDKFREYTEANSLGITILLLFTIVFISSINTMFVESKNPLDALVMVSNAFTSNGYAVLGTTVPGKINSVILVWSGFIISGVGTATLTMALSARHYNEKFEQLNKKLEELEELIEKNKN